MSSRVATLLPLVLPLAACASQVDGNYHGQPLAKLAGMVSTEKVPAPSVAEINLLWAHINEQSPYADTSIDRIGGESVDVQGSFPAAFQLAMYEPPPDNAMSTLDGGAPFAIGYVFAVNPGIDWSNKDNYQANILGWDPQHLLAYFPQDVTAGDTLSYVFAGTPTAGTHLYTAQPLTDQQRQMRTACITALPPPVTIVAQYQQCGGSWGDDLVPDDTELDQLHVDMPQDLSTLGLVEWTDSF